MKTTTYITGTKAKTLETKFFEDTFRCYLIVVPRAVSVCTSSHRACEWNLGFSSLSENSTHTSLLISWLVWKENFQLFKLNWWGLQMWQIQLFSQDIMKGNSEVCVKTVPRDFRSLRNVLVSVPILKDLFSQVLNT